MDFKRRIPLEGTENTRDLGGYPIGKNLMTRYSVFLRSALPMALSGDDVALLNSMSIGTVIDLRKQEELDRAPCFFADQKDFSYHHLPLSGGELMREGEDRVSDSYMLMTKCESMPKIFTLLSQSSGGCLYHCTAGKDRTGTVSAILLMLAGVSDEDIIADYILTFPYIKGLISGFYQLHPELPRHVVRSDPGYMQAFLKKFYAEYGSAEKYLKNICALSDKIISDLRKKLVVDTTS